jgi:hypothetical protein
MFVARPRRKSDRTTPSDSGRLAVYALQGGVEPGIDVNDIRFTRNGDSVGNTRFSGQISQK